MCRALGGDGFTIGYSNRALFLFCMFLYALSGCSSSASGAPEICDGGVMKTPVQISVAWCHTCALDNEGSVWCWGINEKGLLGGETDLTYSTVPLEIQGLSDIIEVDENGFHGCALDSANKIHCWGWNHMGQLGDGTTIGATMPVEVTPFCE